MTNEMPKSTALIEASPDSLSELFSRDPEGYTSQDLNRIIAEIREQRKRWEAAEAAGKTTIRQKKLPGTSGNVIIGSSPEDLGL